MDPDFAPYYTGVVSLNFWFLMGIQGQCIIVNVYEIFSFQTILRQRLSVDVHRFHCFQAFDAGECGFGNCVNSLELGCDCLGSIKYFDAVLSNNSGEPYVVKNAVCLHEEDAG